MTTAQNENTPRSEVAAKVRGKAAERRISILALSEATGIEYSAMLRRTRGDVEFTAADLVAVANALDVDVADLLPRRDSQAVAS